MAGLVATLSGTLELVLEDPGADTEAAELAADAARALTVRLRLYRAAWGGGDLEQASLTALAAGLPNRARLTLDLSRLDAARAQDGLDDDGARLVLCLLIAATSGMPLGGSITGCTDGRGLALTLAGRNAAWPAGMTGGGPAAALAAQMAHMLAAKLGWRLTVDGASMAARPG
jgi:hypothetical protein